MVIRLSHDIFCDRCAEWKSVFVGYEAKTRFNRARKVARRDGWVTRRENGKLIDLCPDCIEGEKEDR